MNVVVNSEEVMVEEGTSLACALKRLRIDAGSGTAVAVNHQVIPRDQWSTHQLEDGANVLVLKATQGG